MRSIKLNAYAKVNLSLNITGKTANGMHTLDSVMVSVDKCDYVTVTERCDEQIVVKFNVPDIGADNTAYRAAKAVWDIIGGNGWDITVEKGIPIGAGLGGSSADGAAVLRALDVLYRLPQRGVDMRAVALGIGSDVPFMLTGGLARVRGTGEDMFFMGSKLNFFCVGIMCGAVGTRECYAEFDKMYKTAEFSPTDTDKFCKLLLDGDVEALELVGNALYKPAVKLLPSIEKAVDTLRHTGGAVNLTGSGGMVVGVFTTIDALSACIKELNANGAEYCVFSSVKTGILHTKNF